MHTHNKIENKVKTTKKRCNCLLPTLWLFGLYWTWARKAQTVRETHTHTHGHTCVDTALIEINKVPDNNRVAPEIELSMKLTNVENGTHADTDLFCAQHDSYRYAMHLMLGCLSILLCQRCLLRFLRWTLCVIWDRIHCRDRNCVCVRCLCTHKAYTFKQ